MNFASHSQAGQDHFVHLLLPHINGTFIDVGCAHPIDLSNTYWLESEMGWRGFLCDIDAPAIGLHRSMRASPAACIEATTCDWRIVMGTHQPQWAFPPTVDYLSADIDEFTHEALKNLLRYGIRARVMTVEHDQYQRGDTLRLPNRALLKAHGYDLLCADVHNTGCSFEDWFVAPDLVDMTVAEKFRSNGLDWADVLKQGGAL